MISKQLIAGFATLFAATAANDACYNYGEPELVDILAAHYVPSCLDTYSFYPEKWSSWFSNIETPKSYGDTLDTDPNGCGDISYVIECDNVSSSVVYMGSYYASSIYIKPAKVSATEDFTSTCWISAYFTNYPPMASQGQSNWAEKEFYIDWLY